MKEKKDKDIESFNKELSTEELEQVSGGLQCGFSCPNVFDCTDSFTCGTFSAEELQ